ncbi:MAG: SDR family oxidoreductase [Gammaproteobacteria bacterium]|nr:SDR family oxidoreductase [Gammaproteobacteria bacterium]
MKKAEVDHLFSVTGKTALVTGGTSGIGLMLAGGLAACGAQVFITGRKAETLETAVAMVSKQGHCRGMHHDVSTSAGVDALAAELAEQTQSLDILINNAGTTWGAPLAKFPDSAWDKVMSINVRSPFMLVQRLLPQLEAAGSMEKPARIVNIGSVFGISPDVSFAYSYGASKAAIHQLTRILARDLSSRGITVNAIAPGFFPSKMTAFIEKDPALNDSILAGIPLRRQGCAEDIVGAVRFLCSAAGSYVTGVILPLDGGKLLNG